MTSNPGISVRGLNKSYQGIHVLTEVSFDAPAGAITGFLGPNGAGKSTTLRIAADLCRATSGIVEFGGRRLAELPNPGRHVGFVLDPTALHPGRSVRETLVLSALFTGTDTKAVDGILELIGLTGAKRHMVKALSLGMRQRLVLGMALLPGPRFLVLDEPTNGLDADGAIWVRRFLGSFADDGGTVLISSHLLRDIQSMAHNIVMIDRGRIVAEGKTEEFITTGGCQVEAINPSDLQILCEAQNWPFHRNGPRFLINVAADVIGQATMSGGVPLRHLSTTQESALEARFLELTHGEFSTRLTNTEKGR